MNDRGRAGRILADTRPMIESEDRRRVPWAPIRRRTYRRLTCGKAAVPARGFSGASMSCRNMPGLGMRFLSPAGASCPIGRCGRCTWCSAKNDFAARVARCAATWRRRIGNFPAAPSRDLKCSCRPTHPWKGFPVVRAVTDDGTTAELRSGYRLSVRAPSVLERMARRAIVARAPAFARWAAGLPRRAWNSLAARREKPCPSASCASPTNSHSPAGRCISWRCSRSRTAGASSSRG